MSAGRVRHFATVISVLFTGTAMSSALAFLTQILLARSLTSSDFGRLSVMLVAINFFTPVGSAGVNWLLLRVFGQEGWAAVRWARSATLLVSAGTAVSAAGLVVYLAESRIVSFDSDLYFAAAVCILLGQIAVELGSSSYQIEDRFKRLTALQMAPQVGRFLLVAPILLFIGPAMSVVVAGYGALGLALTLVGVRSLIELAGKARRLAGGRAAAIPRVRDILLEASPFAMMTAFYVAYFQGGLVLVERLAGSTAAAEFNASSLLFVALALIPNVVYMKFLMAKLCRWAEHDRETFVAAFHVGVLAMAGLGAVLALMLAVSAPYLVPLLYGGKYADAATLVMIRAIAVPINFAQMTYSSLFISRIDMTRKVFYLGITSVVALVANLVLISAYGVVGAAVASVIAEVVLLALHILGTARHIGGIDVLATPRMATLRASLQRLMTHQDAGEHGAASVRGD